VRQQPSHVRLEAEVEQAAPQAEQRRHAERHDEHLDLGDHVVGVVGAEDPAEQGHAAHDPVEDRTPGRELDVEAVGLAAALTDVEAQDAHG